MVNLITSLSLLLLLMLAGNMATPLLYNSGLSGREKYRRIAEYLIHNSVIIEGYKYRRIYREPEPLRRGVIFAGSSYPLGLPPLKDVNEVYFLEKALWRGPSNTLYSLLYPSYLIKNNTVITVSKGDSVILSLSTILLAAAMAGYRSLWEMPREPGELERDLLEANTRSINEYNVEVTGNRVIFRRDSPKHTYGPPVFLDMFYWQYLNATEIFGVKGYTYREYVLENYEGLLEGIRGLGAYEPRVKALYFPFLIQWSIDNPSVGHLYPAMLSDTLPQAFIPYALKDDIKFTVHYSENNSLLPNARKPLNIIMPSSTGRSVHYTRLDILDPTGSLEENTVIIAPEATAKPGDEFTLTIYITHTILHEARAKYVIKFRVGGELWSYLQGDKLSEETINNTKWNAWEIIEFASSGHSDEVNIYEEDSSRVKHIVWYGESQSDILNTWSSWHIYMENKHTYSYYLFRKPTINVELKGYGRFGEAILEITFTTSLNYNADVGNTKHDDKGGMVECCEKDPFTNETHCWEYCVWEYRDSKHLLTRRDRYSTLVKALVAVGGALPIGSAIAPAVGQRGYGDSRGEASREEISTYFYSKSDAVNANGTCYTYGEGEYTWSVDRYRSAFRSTSFAATLEVAPDPYRLITRNISVLKIELKPTNSVAWESVYSGSSASGVTGYFKRAITYGSFFYSPNVIYYKPSGEPGVPGGARESYVRISVDTFYAAPGDEVNVGVKTVYDGGGVSSNVDIAVSIEGATYKLFTVSTDSSGEAEFTFEIPSLEYIKGLLGLNRSNANITEVTVEVSASVKQYNMSDYALVHVPLGSVIAGFFYAADLLLEYNDERISTPVVSTTFTHLYGELIDGEVGDVKHDAAIAISTVSGEDVVFTLTATNTANRSEVYEVSTTISSYMLRVPEGSYELVLTIKVGDRVFRMEPEIVDVSFDTIVIHNFQVPVPLILRAEKLLNEVRDWSIRNNDVYYMILALLKATGTPANELIDLLNLIIRGDEEAVNAVGNEINGAIEELLGSIYESPPQVDSFTSIAIEYLEKLRSKLGHIDPEGAARYLSTVNATLELPPCIEDILLLDRTSSLPKYDPEDVRTNPDNPYNKAIRLLLYLAYLRNRKNHIPSIVWTLVKLSSLQTVIWMTKNLQFFRAPIGPLKTVNPVRWFRLKALQISLLALGGLDLNLGISKSYTLKFLSKCGEVVHISPGAIITAYFKITRFSFAAAVGEFRKDMQFEVLFHLTNMMLSNVVLRYIYIPRIERYLNTFVDELRAGRSSGSLEDAVANTMVMDYNTNLFESFMEGTTQITNSVLNIGRAISGILEIGSAARTIFDKNYLDVGDTVYKLISLKIGETTLYEWKRVSVDKLSPRLKELFSSAKLGNLVRVLKVSSTAALGLTVALAAADVLLFSPKYASATAVTILNSTIKAEELSFPQGIFRVLGWLSSPGISEEPYEDRVSFKPLSIEAGGWSNAVELANIVAGIRDDAATSFINGSDISRAIELFRSIRGGIVELELAAISDNRDPTVYTGYRIALEDSFEEFLEELAVYFDIPGINVARLTEAADNLINLLANITGLPEPPDSISGNYYRILIDIQASPDRANTYIVNVLPYGNPPADGILKLYGVNLDLNASEIPIDLGGPSRLAVEAGVVGESIAGLLEATVFINGVPEATGIATVPKPLLNLWNNSFAEGIVYSLTPVNISSNNNVIELRNVGTNYLVIKTDTSINFTAVDGAYGVTAIRNSDGSYTYFIISVECSSITGAPGQFTPQPFTPPSSFLPLTPLAIGAVATATSVAVALLVYFRKKHR